MIKRLIYRLIVSLVTFAIGLSLTSIWNLLCIKQRPVVLQSNVNAISDSSLGPAITVCALEDHPQLYLGKRVRLRGWVIAKDEQTLVEGPAYRFDKLLEITIKLGKSEESAYISLGKNPCTTSTLTDVEVIGYLEPKMEIVNSQHHYHISDAHIVRVRGEYCF